jgi:hypothetical protein
MDYGKVKRASVTRRNGSHLHTVDICGLGFEVDVQSVRKHELSGRMSGTGLDWTVASAMKWR